MKCHKVKHIIENLNKDHGKNIIQVKNLRRAIGLLGLALAPVCAIGSYLITQTPCLDSVSAYYFTNMQDYFVATLSFVGLFLLSYRGYNGWDTLVSAVMGFCALLVAAFPTSDGANASLVGMFKLSAGVSGIIHIAAASALFVLMALMSLFLFTKTNLPDKKNLPEGKNRRNIIYKTSGCVILICIGLFVILKLFYSQKMDGTHLVLALECVMLLAFCLSWLIKGETFFKDRKDN